MAWLSIQIIVEILVAAVLGGVAGWALHTLYGKRAVAKATAAASAANVSDADSKLRIAELESELDKAVAEADDLRRKSGIARPGERSEAPPEGSLAWRNRHLESRVRFLESRLADFESEGEAAPARQNQNDEATRLGWRNRYLEGRVKYLEEELIRAGALEVAMPAMPEPEPIPDPDEHKPALLEAPIDGRADDLKLIGGIGPKLEQKLNALGVWHYAQISAWTQDEAIWIATAASLNGRVDHTAWQAQAAQLLERRNQSDLEEEAEANGA